MTSWIRIRILNADPDPGGIKRPKQERKNAFERQIIRHKKDKKQCTVIGLNLVNVALFSLKLTFNLSF
jgi:hypothetical protein